MSSSARLWFFLFIVGLVLWLTRIEGTFSSDEDHHTASIVSLKHNGYSVPIPPGVPKSVELAAFNPAISPYYHYKQNKKLLTPRPPPWYALLAYPFAQLGWSYLLLLNLLAYLLAAWLVYLYTSRYSDQSHSAWLACLVFLFGSYTLEYAVAVWPHMLSLCLCLASAYCAARTRDNETLWWACLCGILIGIATGIRYQNALWCGAIGLGIFFGSPRRFKSSLVYLVSVTFPLLVSSWFNFLRFQSWNPITKGGGYLKAKVAAVKYKSNAFEIFWAKVFDFSEYPSFILPRAKGYMSIEHQSGAYLVMDVVRKAFVQSAPWAILAIAVMFWAWQKKRSALSPSQKRELRTHSVIVLFLLGAFSLVGPFRHAGFCHNQRYFLDILPLCCIALAWGLEGISFRSKALLGGIVNGVGLILLLLLLGTLHPIRLWLILKLPILFGTLTLGVWLYASSRQKGAGWLWATVGLCLGWACAIHLSDDVRNMRHVRSTNQQRSQQLTQLLPPQTPSILFAHGRSNSLVAPLRLSHQLMWADPYLDRGHDTVKLMHAYLQAKHLVYLNAKGISPNLLKKIKRTFSLKLLHKKGWFHLFAVTNKPPGQKGH